MNLDAVNLVDLAAVCLVLAGLIALVTLSHSGQIHFDTVMPRWLLRMYAFDQINAAIADSKSCATVKPILKFPSATV